MALAYLLLVSSWNQQTRDLEKEDMISEKFAQKTRSFNSCILKLTKKNKIKSCVKTTTRLNTGHQYKIYKNPKEYKHFVLQIIWQYKCIQYCVCLFGTWPHDTMVYLFLTEMLHPTAKNNIEIHWKAIPMWKSLH